MLAMLRSRDQLQVHFDGDVLRRQLQQMNEVGDRRIVGKLALDAVESDEQG